ncbi:MAG: hypothetical protein H7263_18985 [Candidatus Sericytochromatia bacterium]|nr:hypothetical protein [Candidatus Sericytochromatia bacterium]
MEEIYKRFIYENSLSERKLENGLSIFKAFKENVSDVGKLNLHIIIHGNYIDPKLKDIHKNVTVNNHIIQASYFSQWTSDYKINKDKSTKQQRVLIKGSDRTPKLDNYMQKNFGLNQSLENYFTGKKLTENENKQPDKYVNSEILKLRLVDKIVKQEGLHSFYFEIIPEEQDNRVKFAFFYDDRDPMQYKKNGDIKQLNYLLEKMKENDLIINIQKFVLFLEVRQNLWSYIQEDTQPILEEMLKEYNKAGNFNKYKDCVQELSNILLFIWLENIENMRKLNINYATLYKVERFMENLILDTSDSINIKFFIEHLLKILNKKSLNKNIIRNINTAFFVDKLQEIENKQENIMIIASKNKLHTSNLPIFKLNDYDIKVFPLTPHLLCFKGVSEEIKKIKAVINKIDYAQIYENELSKRKNCEIIKLSDEE